eukprot:TRINITY_DN1252_c0_g1_i1.p2 TRINITY_DN1252_c0_g1~~TRINITY_DN1252_c0_g1_i1.p2  ORF type:complete len:211 (-),score=38.04 TRINITY_DN1252_c0_g1_i1:610-1242(-)
MDDLSVLLSVEEVTAGVELKVVAVEVDVDLKTEDVEVKVMVDPGLASRALEAEVVDLELPDDVVELEVSVVLSEVPSTVDTWDAEVVSSTEEEDDGSSDKLDVSSELCKSSELVAGVESDSDGLLSLDASDAMVESSEFIVSPETVESSKWVKSVESVGSSESVDEPDGPVESSLSMESDETVSVGSNVSVGSVPSLPCDVSGASEEAVD